MKWAEDIRRPAICAGENDQNRRAYMEILAKVLVVCGILTAAISLLLLGYNEQGSASYMLCLMDIIIGFIMFIFGMAYLLILKNKQK